MKPAVLILLVALVAFYSCKKSGTNSPSGPNVYAAGYWGNGQYTVAAYWVNGKLVSLTDTTWNSLASALYVSGNDVYVAGSMDSLMNDLSTDRATFWKNGQPIHLGTPGWVSGASAIVVEGNDVFVAGMDGGLPVYWQNGQETILNGAYPGSGVNSIAISGGDVYVPGEDSLRNPCYWKNGLLTELPGGFYANVAAIAVSGNDVFVAGRVMDTLTSHWVATLWKDGTPVALSDGSQEVTVNDITTDGTDVYVCGNTATTSGYVSTVWKNGQPFSMPNFSPSVPYAWSICVVNGKVFVGGNTLSYGPHSTAAYWSANGLVTLDNNPNQGSNIWGIFVR